MQFRYVVILFCRAQLHVLSIVINFFFFQRGSNFHWYENECSSKCVVSYCALINMEDFVQMPSFHRKMVLYLGGKNSHTTTNAWILIIFYLKKKKIFHLKKCYLNVYTYICLLLDMRDWYCVVCIVYIVYGGIICSSINTCDINRLTPDSCQLSFTVHP